MLFRSRLNGGVGGTASNDNCGICSDGNTGHDANIDMDCAGTCFGEAQLYVFYSDNDGDVFLELLLECFLVLDQ